MPTPIIYPGEVKETHWMHFYTAFLISYLLCIDRCYLMKEKNVLNGIPLSLYDEISDDRY
jgi:hypothetical protein